MSTILIDRDVKYYGRYDVKTNTYKDIKIVHEQHLVDLDKVAFTCNSRFGYVFGSPATPQKLIRGIILPTNLFFGIDDSKLQLSSGESEILIDSLPIEQQKKIYGLFNEEELYNIWTYVVCPAATSNSCFAPDYGWRCSDSCFNRSLKRYLQPEIPLMLFCSAPMRRIPVEKDGHVYWINKGPTCEPLLIQPGAFVGISEECNEACSHYGYAKLADDRYQHLFSRYHDLIQEKLEGFRK